jgi:hypothetical protein
MSITDSQRMMNFMSDRDPAFLWETEALRAAPQRVVEGEIDSAPEAEPGGRWRTLREANRATGIPVETLRKWARRGTIPTFLRATQLGTNIRLVDLDGVQERAAELGRTIESEPDSSEPASAPHPSHPLRRAEPTPPGTMIVPVDAWNKMLAQLGNLHEAGQQLATARERAAKAETEATFLRERLAEMRSELVAARTGPQTRATELPATEVATEATKESSATQPPEKVWQYLLRRVRERG